MQDNCQTVVPSKERMEYSSSVSKVMGEYHKKHELKNVAVMWVFLK